MGVSKCKVCRSEFKKRSISHKCCSPECAEQFAIADRQRKERRDTKDRKDRLKSRTEWLREAQTAFNSYIRERDRNLPCISCGRFHGGSYDAGHYRSVGAAPHLRFDEDNCHKQCVPCNQYKSGNSIEYRIGLVARIGEDSVVRLESSNTSTKWSIDDAKRIKEEYKRKLKELKSAKM